VPADLIPDLIPALSVTVAPSVALTALAWALRGEPASRRVWSPRAVPAAEILARLRAEVERGELPADPWGGVDRPHTWTVQPSTELVLVSLVDEARRMLEVAA